MNRFKKRHARREASAVRRAYLDAYLHAPIIPRSVLLEARDGDAIDGNIFYILRELLTNPAYSDFEIMVSVRDDAAAASAGAKLSPIDASRAGFLTVGSPEYYEAFATAEYLVNDATITNFYIKKDGQKYLNVWHGTPLKNMGRHVAHEPHAVGIAQMNFLAADYLLYPSEYMRDLMYDAYMLPNLAPGKAILSGYPRNSAFFDSERRVAICRELEEKKSFGRIEWRKIYVYMPTWRPEMMADEMADLMGEFDAQLTDDEILFVKIHPLAASSLDFGGYKHIKAAPGDYETYEFLNIADCLITDYSSVFFDFAVTGRNVVLFTYDEAEYLATRGLYIGLDELPFPRTATVGETLAAARAGKSYDDSEFMTRFCPYESADAAEKLCSFFFLGDEAAGESFKLEAIPNNGKPNVLVCGDDLGKAENYEAVVNYLKECDLTEKNYYLLFNKSEIAPNTEKLLSFPEGAGFIGYTGGMFAFDGAAGRLKAYKNGELDIHRLIEAIPEELKLEYRRRYTGMRCDEVVYLGNPVIR